MKQETNRSCSNVAMFSRVIVDIGIDPGAALGLERVRLRGKT